MSICLVALFPTISDFDYWTHRQSLRLGSRNINEYLWWWAVYFLLTDIMRDQKLPRDLTRDKSFRKDKKTNIKHKTGELYTVAFYQRQFWRIRMKLRVSPAAVVYNFSNFCTLHNTIGSLESNSSSIWREKIIDLGWLLPHNSAVWIFFAVFSFLCLTCCCMLYIWSDKMLLIISQRNEFVAFIDDWKDR